MGQTRSSHRRRRRHRQRRHSYRGTGRLSKPWRSSSACRRCDKRCGPRTAPRCSRPGASNSCLTGRRPSSIPTSRSDRPPASDTQQADGPSRGHRRFVVSPARRKTATSPANRRGSKPAPTSAGGPFVARRHACLNRPGTQLSGGWWPRSRTTLTQRRMADRRRRCPYSSIGMTSTRLSTSTGFT